MTTEREYREWQAKKKKHHNKERPKLNIWLVLAIIAFAGYSAWKAHHQQDDFLEEKSPPEISPKIQEAKIFQFAQSEQQA